MSDTILEIRGARKEFLRRGKGKARAFNAVADANLELHAGDFVSCVGRSGSGKTTLLNMMAGLLAPTEGTVLLEGQDLYSLGDSELSKLRNATIGVVPQGQTGIGSLTLLENVMLPWRMYRCDGNVEQEARALLKELGIESLADSYPTELSGGELRRMSIARALVCKPRLLLTDEPTGDLDDASTSDVLDALERAARQGAAVFMVTHDSLATERAIRTIHMNAGSLSI